MAKYTVDVKYFTRYLDLIESTSSSGLPLCTFYLIPLKACL